eukprot:CAMPEP_0170189032 /NCGR_PEP_ID=MMETSP0040_2-20121228/45842_1 /TAXON_ID=641309 /ORGANISM="Lotharella oceanica, Strain CCMP622" /LENGTH=225 /DNA_ID=CAMNT_0010436485 /DNA_START=94 /DNA_END=775 /DNA_ORIENTATION=-
MSGARLVLGGEKRLRLDASVSEAMRLGGEAISAPMDMTKKEDYENLILQALAAYRNIDYLILNTDPSTSFCPLFADWNGFTSIDRVLSRHLTLPVYAVQLCLPHLMKRSGCIMAFSHSSSNDPHPCTNALEGFLKGLQDEFQASKANNVHILSVSIGDIKADSKSEAGIIASSAVRALATRTATLRMDTQWSVVADVASDSYTQSGFAACFAVDVDGEGRKKSND